MDLESSICQMATFLWLSFRMAGQYTNFFSLNTTETTVMGNFKIIKKTIPTAFITNINFNIRAIYKIYLFRGKVL